MDLGSPVSSELTLDVTCTPRNRANLRRLKTNSVQSFQRWEKENELLYAMIEDETAWLAKLFTEIIITPDFFFYALEDGTLLCKLANYIQKMADTYGQKHNTHVPGKKIKFKESKRGHRESKLFHSRENVQKFLTWCRWHDIPEAILFESNDVVLVDECRTGGREIVICLMEIARRVIKYEIKQVPKLIQLEQEIDEEEANDSEDDVCLGQDIDIAAVNTENVSDKPGDRSPDSDSGVDSVFDEGDQPTSPRLNLNTEIHEDKQSIIKDPNDSARGTKDRKRHGKGEKAKIPSLLEITHPKTELDKKVCKIAEDYNIKLVHRLKEGKYIILGKVMFVRMLNDHLLVRIGGGWDTLEHYIMTHAPKPANSEAQFTDLSSPVRSSGIWGKLVDKVKRRESQPNLYSKDSPVVLSKGERIDSSSDPYTLRDRVRKKFSVTEKDEKDISDAIRKIESNLTSKSSPSFTSKTFFQLKSRFDKGVLRKDRKLSRDNSIESNQGKMADQWNGEMNGMGETQNGQLQAVLQPTSTPDDTSPIDLPASKSDSVADQDVPQETNVAMFDPLQPEFYSTKPEESLATESSQVEADQEPSSAEVALSSGDPNIDSFLIIESQEGKAESEGTESVPQGEAPEVDIAEPTSEETPVEGESLEAQAVGHVEAAGEETSPVQSNQIESTVEEVPTDVPTESPSAEVKPVQSDIVESTSDEAPAEDLVESHKEEIMPVQSDAIQSTLDKEAAQSKVIASSPEEVQADVSVESPNKETLPGQSVHIDSTQEEVPVEAQPESRVDQNQTPESLLPAEYLVAPPEEQPAPAAEPEPSPGGSPSDLSPTDPSPGESPHPEADLSTEIAPPLEAAPNAVEDEAKPESERSGEPADEHKLKEAVAAAAVTATAVATTGAAVAAASATTKGKSPSKTSATKATHAKNPKSAKPGSSSTKPGTSAKPGAATAKPGAASAKPEAVPAKTGAASTKSGPSAAKPGSAKSGTLSAKTGEPPSRTPASRPALQKKAEENKPERPKSAAAKSQANTRPASKSTPSGPASNNGTVAAKPSQARPLASAKRPASAQAGRPANGAAKPDSLKPSTAKTTARPASTTKKPATSSTKPATDDKKQTKPATTTNASKTRPASSAAKPKPTSAVGAHPKSAHAKTTADHVDGKPQIELKPKASGAATRMTSKTTTVTKGASPAKTTRVTKTTETKNGDATSKTTTVKKTTSVAGVTKTVGEAKTSAHPPKTTITKRPMDAKDGKPGKPATMATKTKPGSARPTSPPKGRPSSPKKTGEKKKEAEKAPTQDPSAPPVSETAVSPEERQEPHPPAVNDADLSHAQEQQEAPLQKTSEETRTTSFTETTEDGVTKTTVTQECVTVADGEERTVVTTETVTHEVSVD